jgi:hypothetical protein
MNYHGETTRPLAGYPYHVYLGDTHVVEVKKGATHIGIYLITPSLRRRGVVLPIAIWQALQESIPLVNLAVDINCSHNNIQPQQNGTASVTNQYPIYQEGTFTGQTVNNGRETITRDVNNFTNRNYSWVENDGPTTYAASENAGPPHPPYTDLGPGQLYLPTEPTSYAPPSTTTIPGDAAANGFTHSQSFKESVDDFFNFFATDLAEKD